MKTLRTIPIMVLLLTLAVSASAKNDTSRLPGYVDLSAIEVPDDATEVRLVDLGPDMLADVVKKEASDNDALAQIIARIQAVHVKSFAFPPEQATRVRGYFDKIAKSLEKDGWQRLVYVQGKEELVSVSTQRDDKGVAGWMVMVLDDSDATFANLVGDIDLAAIAGLALNSDDGDLEDLVQRLQAQ